MNVELRRKMVTARKQHRCSLCTHRIRPGEEYERATLIYDGRIGDFLTCNACIDDRIPGRVYDYWGGEEGVNDEDAYEWALDCTSNPGGVPADEIDAARRFIDRYEAATQYTNNKGVAK